MLDLSTSPFRKGLKERSLSFLVYSCFIILLSPFQAEAGKAKLDKTFGSGGVVTWDSGGLDFGTSATIDSFGNILVAGYDYDGYDQDLTLTRFTPGGVLDTSFGGGDGVVTWSVSKYDFARSVTIDGSGNILVAGMHTYSSCNNGCDFSLTRLTSDGVLDASFGGNGGVGVAIWGFSRHDYAYSVSTDSSGNILVAGAISVSTEQSTQDLALMRLTSSGVLDTSFGNGDGLVTWGTGSLEQGRSVTIDDSGNILVAGLTLSGGNYDVVLTRFTSDGVLDTTFGDGDGVVIWDDSHELGYSVTTTTDGSGNILVAGQSSNGSDTDFVLLRFTSSGVLDTSFGGGDGIATWDSGSSDVGWSVTIDCSGNIFVAGQTYTGGSENDFALARFTPLGELDTRFGGGAVTWDGGSNDLARIVMTDGSGNIFVAGESNNGTNQDYALIKYLGDNCQ